jgi:hypothetical protein
VDAMRAGGFASEERLRAAVASLAAFTADPVTIIGGPQVFQAWSRRPA